MKKQSSNRSGLLLIEIIIAILFFSIVSAICLQLFVKSHNLSKESEVLVSAVNQVSSMIEEIQHSDQTFEDTTLYYDDAFSSRNAAKDAYYELQVVGEVVDNRTSSYMVTMRNKKTGDTVYEQAITVYKPVTM